MKWKLASIVAVLTLALAVALPLFAQEADDIDVDNDDVVWAGGWGRGGGHGDWQTGKVGDSGSRATSAAGWRLRANGGPGQIDFAHVVSTNYSQYKM